MRREGAKGAKQAANKTDANDLDHPSTGSDTDSLFRLRFFLRALRGVLGINSQPIHVELENK
jgi:hypothetical protein